MTIVFFSRRFWPMGGGVEKHVLEVGKRLVEKGYKVTVVTESPPPRSPFGHLGGDESTIDGIDIVRHDSGRGDWFKKFRIWKWLWQQRELIKNADIVHAHDVFFWCLPFRFLYPTKPVYTTFHGYETKFPPKIKAILWRKLSEKLSWGNICVGDFIRKWYGTKADFVTYGGVDVHLGGVHSATVRGVNKKLKIVLIGRLERDIGVQLYLDALNVLKEKKVDFGFEAYGEGSLRKQVEQYGKVHAFTNNLQMAIEKADIVFASSYLSILSAMVAKRLVFAVYDNLLKEDYLKMAPFAKWVIIENSVQKLAEKIIYFQNHKAEKDNLTSAGYNWVKNQTWEKVVEIYVKLWWQNVHLGGAMASQAQPVTIRGV